MQRIFIGLAASICLIAALPVHIGGPKGNFWSVSQAFAGGGGGGEQGLGSGKSDKGKKKSIASQVVPDTTALRAPRSGPVQREQDALARAAKRDALRELATRPKKLRAFVHRVDKLIDGAKTQREKVEANNILVQLNRYKRAGRKHQNLAFYANGILLGRGAIRAFDRMKRAEAALAAAKKTGDDVKVFKAEQNLKEDTRRYRRAYRRVPDVFKGLHPAP